MKNNIIKVLLIEDNPGDARLIQELLGQVRDMKFEMKHADRLSTGLENLAQKDFDIILLDLILPESSGMETLYKVNSFSPGIPIVVLTGIANGNLGITAIQEGAQDYLVKGQVDSESLARSLRYSMERKKSEDAHIDLQKKYEDLVNSLPVGVFRHTLDKDGLFLDVNPEMVSIFEGNIKEDLLSYKVVDIYQDPNDFALMKDKAMEEGFVRDIELQLVTLKGKKFWASVTCVVKKDFEGRIFFDGIIEDVSERKRVEQMKSDFVSLVSHQLKTPVAQINGYVNNMLSGITGAITPKQRDYLEDMQRITKNGYNLISDLLNVSRIERGVVSINLRPVDLKEILDQAVREYRQAIIGKGLALNIDDPGVSLMVIADKDKMAEALFNIINNAVKFTEKGSINISLSGREGFGIIEVKDTGKGISPENMLKLFDKGQVLSGTPQPEAGSGLGLYIAKQFMVLQKGDIAVTSKVGEGSNFVFKIPLVSV